MRRLAPFLAVALALASLAGCGKTDCEKLGENLCGCTGIGSDACKTQVEEQLKTAGASEAVCTEMLKTCNAPSGAAFCEWLLTEDGKTACGIAP